MNLPFLPAPARGAALAAALLGAVTVPALAAGDKELGQHLSSECSGCHQTSGAQSGGVPAIVGWPQEQFVAVMLSYKNKDRPNQIMQTIAGRLSREEIEALAAWYGSNPK
jgi:cytochrome c553